MKVSLLSYSDIEGGAARASYRLHQGLQRVGVNSQMLVQIKSSDDVTVIGSKNVGMRQAIAGLRTVADSLPLKRYSQQKGSTYSTQWLPDRIISKLDHFRPDIVNLHWTNNGYLQIESLNKIQQPIVWTLHDMWSFTGGCHYNQACDRYTMSCGQCPQIESQRDGDLSNWIWQRKAKAWKNLDLTIVTPSVWLSQCAKASALFQNLRIEVIPYGLDTTRYRPMDRSIARQILGLPSDQRLILAGALQATSDQRKGIHLLQPALTQLSQSGWGDRTELVIFGASKPTTAVDFGLNVHYMGTLGDDISLAMLYAAADVFVAPSVQDNLPNTVMESMACGTPCVAFNIGGMPDMIDHRYNGYLARPYESADFAQGIAWVLEDADRHQKLCHQARQKTEQAFTLNRQADCYQSLFSELLNRSELATNITA
jgi:glycosyltransferase involved in cell wall biosynthesis